MSIQVWRCTLFGIMLSSIFRKSGIQFSVRKCNRIRKIEQLLFPRKQKLLWSIGVALKPSRPGLPVGQPGPTIANRHLDLRQTLFVEDRVLRDHLVHEQQVGRQRVYLIGLEGSLSPERHAAIDVIPHGRRKRRAQRQDALPSPDGKIRTGLRFQGRPETTYSLLAMADDTALECKDLLAFLGGATAGREFLPRLTDVDIPGANFFCGRNAPQAIGWLRLRQCWADQEGAAQEQQSRGKLKRQDHWSPSRPWRSSTA